MFKAFLRLRVLLETCLFVLYVFLCWLLLLCSFNCRIWNRDFNVHGDEVGIMKILPIFCLKMSNIIEGGGGGEMLNCISRWIRHAGKKTGRSLEPRVVLNSTLLCGGTRGKNGKPTQDSRCPGKHDKWLSLGYLIANPLVLCWACFAVLSEQYKCVCVWNRLRGGQ